MIIVENWRFTLILFAIIGSGLTGGIFFAFSTFVMQALGRLPSAQGISAMQEINVTVINPWFVTAFFAPGIAGILLSVSLFFDSQPTVAPYLLTASLLYLIGTIGTTFLGNIPLNDALAVVSPTTAKATTIWTKYLTDWTFWNHVRTLAALLSAAIFAMVFYG